MASDWKGELEALLLRCCWKRVRCEEVCKGPLASHGNRTRTYVKLHSAAHERAKGGADAVRCAVQGGTPPESSDRDQ